MQYVEQLPVIRPAYQSSWSTGRKRSELYSQPPAVVLGGPHGDEQVAPSNMELRHLRYVVAVATELNFGRAAEKLNISQPPLSHQIRLVEEELGVKLFTRTKRSVEVTEAGRVFVAGAREILQHTERTAAAAVAASRGEIGELRIGTVTTTDSGFYQTFVAILRAFSARCPGVHLRLQTLSVQQQVQHLLDRRLDIGFVTMPILDARLVTERVRSEPLVVVLPEGHPLTKMKALPAAALASERIIVMSRYLNPGFFDLVVSYFRSAGFSVLMSDEADGIYTSLALVAAGRGISVLPSSLLEAKRPGVTMRPFEPPVPVIEMGAAHASDNNSPALRMFMSVVQSLVRPHTRNDRGQRTSTAPRRTVRERSRSAG
jgi:DNA-binding transcriptional LysR family regulator